MSNRNTMSLNDAFKKRSKVKGTAKPPLSQQQQQLQQLQQQQQHQRMIAERNHLYTKHETVIKSRNPTDIMSHPLATPSRPASGVSLMKYREFSEEDGVSEQTDHRSTPQLPLKSMNNFSRQSSANTYSNMYVIPENDHHARIGPTIMDTKIQNQYAMEIEKLKLELAAKDNELAQKCEELKLMEQHNKLLTCQLDQFNKYAHVAKETSAGVPPPKKKFFSQAFFLQNKLFKRPSRDELKKKNILQNELCFDNEIEKIPQHPNLPYIPVVVGYCIQALEKKPGFMDTPGLYRISGNFAVVQKLRFEIDNKKYSKINDQKDPHTVSSLLKLFLRELKSPLITFEQLKEGVPDLKSFQNDYFEVKICKMQKLVHSIPKINHETLKYIIGHLRRVAEDHVENNMNAEHLAIIFGACIFYDVVQNINITESINVMEIPNLAVEIMIENYTQIFETTYSSIGDSDDDDIDDGSTYID